MGRAWYPVRPEVVVYTLHFSPGAASLVVHLTLLELDAPHTLVRVDLGKREHQAPEYLRLNPNGLIPTLIVDDRPMFETGALLLLLTERHGALAPAIGAPERAVFLQWMFHLANTLQPAYARWFHPDWFAPGQHPEIKDLARQRVERTWDQLDAHLAEAGPYVTGDALTVADFYATMLARWSRNMPRPATTWPHVAELVARIKARPTWKLVYEREGLTEWP